LSVLALISCGSSKPAQSPDSSPSDETSTQSAASDADTGDSSDSGDEEASGDDKTFQLKDSDTARSARGETESKIQATATEAAMKFFVVDKESNEPISGIVISMIAPDGKKYFTPETDKAGYAEVLVPVGKEYE